MTDPTTTEPVSTPQEAAPEVPATPPQPPGYHELGTKARELKAQRDAEAQAKQDAEDAALYRAMKANGLLRPQEQPPLQSGKAVIEAARGRRVEIDLDDPGSIRAALGGDIKAYREWLNRTARHTASPDVVRLEQQLEQVAGKLPEGLDDLRAKIEQLETRDQSARAAAVERAFIGDTEIAGEDGVPRYPLVSRLDPAQRVAEAQAMITEYLDAGIDPAQLTNDFIISQVEARYADLLDKLRPAPAATTTESRPRGGQSQRSSSGTRSLTNDLATPRGATNGRPSASEREQLARASLQRIRASGT